MRLLASQRWAGTLSWWWDPRAAARCRSALPLHHVAGLLLPVHCRRSLDGCVKAHGFVRLVFSARPARSKLGLSSACVLPQSTYCENLRQHCETVGRRIHIANLGAAPHAQYTLPSFSTDACRSNTEAADPSLMNIEGSVVPAPPCRSRSRCVQLSGSHRYPGPGDAGGRHGATGAGAKWVRGEHMKQIFSSVSQLAHFTQRPSSLVGLTALSGSAESMEQLELRVCWVQSCQSSHMGFFSGGVMRRV